MMAIRTVERATDTSGIGMLVLGIVHTVGFLSDVMAPAKSKEIKFSTLMGRP